MKKHWNISIEDHNYNIDFKRSDWTGKQTLTVDGEETKLEHSGMFKNFEVPFKLGNTDAKLSMVGSSVDLIVDGKSLTTGKDYAAPKKAPWYTWLFVVLCVAIPICTLGGALPVVIGLLSAGGCYKICVSGTKKGGTKVVLSILITLAAWIIAILVVFGSVMLLNS